MDGSWFKKCHWNEISTSAHPQVLITEIQALEMPPHFLAFCTRKNVGFLTYIPGCSSMDLTLTVEPSVQFKRQPYTLHEHSVEIVQYSIRWTFHWD